MGVLIEVVGVSIPVCGFHLGTGAGSGVSTLGTIGADEAAEAAKGVSGVGSFGTIANVVEDVAGVCLMAHWSSEMRGFCDAQKR